MKKVKAYLANQYGFSETGLLFLNTFIKPPIAAMDILILDPFEECGKELDFAHLSMLESSASYVDVVSYWGKFNHKVPLINNQLMSESDCLLPLFDGGYILDDGVAGETAFYYSLKRGPIFALRTDKRGGENPAALINPQILGYVTGSGGFLATSLESWFTKIKEWRDTFV